MKKPMIKLDGITLDCNYEDIPALVEFYGKLTGYETYPLSEDTMPAVFGPYLSINFQPVEGYRKPTFPTEERGQMIHLDFYVDDLKEAREYALSLGAVEAPEQFGDSWHIFLDPAGHPFCLTRNGPSGLLDQEDIPDWG